MNPKLDSTLPSNGPLTVGETARLLGVPGPWTVRRLEQRGILPAARRSLVHGDRMYDRESVAAMQLAIRAAQKKEAA